MPKMKLMHKDTEVARMTGESFGEEWDIIKRGLLPMGWPTVNINEEIEKATKSNKGLLGAGKDKSFVFTNGENDITANKTIISLIAKITASNSDKITRWLGERVLPISRQHAKKVYQVLNLPQGQDYRTKATIALAFSGLSITDNYWLAPVASTKTWSSVNLRNRSLSNGIAVLALSGHSLSIEATTLTDPLDGAAEVSVLGAYAKGIFREDDGLYMYKTGEPWTVAAEVVSSDILKCSNVYGHVIYTLAKKQELSCSKCKLMTTDSRDIVHASSFTENPVTLARRKWRKELAQMCVVDYIIANPDRHGLNWGFFREEPTWEVTGLHWLYDHNNAFDRDILEGKIKGNSVLTQEASLSHMDLEAAAKWMYKYSDFKFVKPIPKRAFSMFGKKSGYVIEKFLERCKNLGIEVAIK